MCETDFVTTEQEAIQRWSAAMRGIEVLEPWLTESHLGNRYWDGVATLVVQNVDTSTLVGEARSGLREALAATLLGTELTSANVLYQGRPESTDRPDRCDGAWRDFKPMNGQTAATARGKPRATGQMLGSSPARSSPGA